MSVSAQAIKAISIPTTNLAVQPINPAADAVAVSSDPARARLIEVISRNVKAWTNWTGPERILDLDPSGGTYAKRR
jgi:hypothetical protein